jgi:REP element-mobilizing transposase RayT
MPQSLARILVHLIFSTKNRAPLLSLDLQAELHPYLSTVLNNDGCPAIEAGGVEDHVHLLFGLSRTLTVAQVVENVKTSSSKWIKKQDASLSHFYWQAGYGAFSVSQSNAAAVVHYIQNQAEHHRRESFQDEFRKFLRRHQITYDEKHVWD